MTFLKFLSSMVPYEESFVILSKPYFQFVRENVNYLLFEFIHKEICYQRTKRLLIAIPFRLFIGFLNKK